MDLQEQIQRGEHAKRILDDELVKGALAEVELAVVDQWRALGIENKTQAEELKRLLWASQQFRAIFESLVAGATVARNELLLRENMEIKRDAAKGKLYGS
jgi:hypothetical protein